jgi:hypothetical protein
LVGLNAITKTKAEQLQWRRYKVVEMRARGLSQIEIAHELQVSEASISLNMQYLRDQAKQFIKEYVTEHLPEQYQVCLTAFDAIIKRGFDILESSPDNREKLQAIELFKDTHLVKLELLSNATTIDSLELYQKQATRTTTKQNARSRPLPSIREGRQTIF